MNRFFKDFYSKHCIRPLCDKSATVDVNLLIFVFELRHQILRAVLVKISKRTPLMWTACFKVFCVSIIFIFPMSRSRKIRRSISTHNFGALVALPNTKSPARVNFAHCYCIKSIFFSSFLKLLKSSYI